MTTDAKDLLEAGDTPSTTSSTNMVTNDTATSDMASLTSTSESAASNL